MMPPMNRYRDNKEVSSSVWSLVSVWVRNPAGHRRPIHGDSLLPACIASLTRDVGRLKPRDAEIQGHCDGWAACYPLQARRGAGRPGLRKLEQRVPTKGHLEGAASLGGDMQPAQASSRRNTKGSSAFTLLHPQTSPHQPLAGGPAGRLRTGRPQRGPPPGPGTGWSRKSSLEGVGRKPRVT